jgi:two-component system response regulator HydG
MGADFGLSMVMRMIEQVAPLDSFVLLPGETGTGKEFIANAIHSYSPRRYGSFIRMNCCAIPESLFENPV